MTIKFSLFSLHRKISFAGYLFAAFSLIGLFLPVSLSAQEMGLPAGPVKTSEQPAANDLIKRWRDQRARAMEERSEAVGAAAVDVSVPVELSEPLGGQKAKIAELSKKGRLNVPMDFVALAKLRAGGKLIDVDYVTDTYLLDVGGSSSSDEFTTFSFEKGAAPVKNGSADYAVLSDHINLLNGKKINLMEATDRKRLRIQLLQMIVPEAKQILVELAAAYHEKFGRPLRVSSLARSVDYQIYLSRSNTNAFKVTKDNMLAPHIIGLAFDVPCTRQTGAEQNFLMNKLAELERAGKIDAIAESSENAANILHIFVYPDGKPPQI